MNHRLLSTLGLLLLAAGVHAQSPGAAADVPAPAIMWILAGVAGIQAIIIVALAATMQNLAGLPQWIKNNRGTRTLVALPLLLGTLSANAQAYVPDPGPSYATTMWLLVGVNVLLFVVIMVQLAWIRSLSSSLAPEIEAQAAPEAVAAKRGAWLANLVAKLNRQVKVEDEEAIVLEHDYDGIKELDNVLPPWWLWLFYGTIAWGVVYIVNMHVINIWPDTQQEYRLEMAKAEEDVAAYLATQTNLVDETNVTFTDDPAVIAEGRTLFQDFCTACHGADAAGAENSVGPNLTDPYWIHGGGVKNIFHTIKYGVPDKGMIAWQTQLQPSEIRAITCYVMTREGKGGPTQKGPEGELWEEAGGDDGGDSADEIHADAG